MKILKEKLSEVEKSKVQVEEKLNVEIANSKKLQEENKEITTRNKNQEEKINEMDKEMHRLRLR